MKEPYLKRLMMSGDEIVREDLVPYSQVPSDILRSISTLDLIIEDPDQQDQDFNNRYAAILLRERGI